MAKRLWNSTQKVLQGKSLKNLYASWLLQYFSKSCKLDWRPGSQWEPSASWPATSGWPVLQRVFWLLQVSEGLRGLPRRTLFDPIIWVSLLGKIAFMVLRIMLWSRSIGLKNQSRPCPETLWPQRVHAATLGTQKQAHLFFCYLVHQPVHGKKERGSNCWSPCVFGDLHPSASHACILAAARHPRKSMSVMVYT